MVAMAAVAAALRAWLAAVGADTAGRAALSAWAPLLGSLAALAAQMRAARRLPWDAAPLGAFPELRERLWRKQRGAAEALLEQLGGRRYLESKLLLQRLSCDSLADMEALPQAWERILERHKEDVVKAQTVSRPPGEDRMKNIKPSSQRSADQFLESWEKPWNLFG
ncbi:hypothetical protein WISP_65686 [Willisornis vidua]|uniref:Uncharacterized protein n=1 Tax=Willisornis vidua TaxID=1566151 RepID=A0ABQ9DC12_9PASS|nr:hypothetical protein WISP_65686 [Willisornis vidua]